MNSQTPNNNSKTLFMLTFVRLAMTRIGCFDVIATYKVGLLKGQIYGGKCRIRGSNAHFGSFLGSFGLIRAHFRSV